MFAGAFGSGKSEIAVNYAIECAQQNRAAVLADLDLANPYFVSRDTARVLEQNHVKLLAPDNAMAYGDVPNLPPGIIGILRQNFNTVVDLAGDKAGALVLGYLARFIDPQQFRIYLVINPYRPFSWNIEEIRDLKTMLESYARHLISGIISNPHLVEATDFEVIEQGHQWVEYIAAQLGVPVTQLIVTACFYEEARVRFGEMVKKIDLYLRPSWL